MEFRQQIKDKLKILLEKVDFTEKENLQIDIIIDNILAYCYRKELIAEMVNPVTDVIFDILNNAFMSNNTIQSYSEGDMSVSFAVDTNTIGQYNGKLKPFRKIIGLIIQ